MNEHKNCLVDLAEKVDCHLPQRGWPRWLARQMVPNIGTLLIVVVLLFTIVPSLASPSRAPSAISTSLIPYQGRLADVSGTPINGKEDIEFRIYDVPAGGMPLWEEHWTGANSVDVSDGLFSVLLGSIDNTLASSIQGHEELYLGITVGTDSEMEPRVQMGSVPFAMQANTVLDGSITTAKLVDEAVTSAKIADGTVVTADLANAAVTEAQIANDAVTSAKIADGTVATVDLANDAVTEAKIANDAVGSGQIAANAVGSSEIADGAARNRNVALDIYEAEVGGDTKITHDDQQVMSLNVNSPVATCYMMFTTFTAYRNLAGRTLAKLYDENGNKVSGSVWNFHNNEGLGSTQTAGATDVWCTSAGAHTIRMLVKDYGSADGYVRGGTRVVAIPFAQAP